MYEICQLSSLCSGLNKAEFKYYVSELCRSVRTELSHNDSSVTNHKDSLFNQTSVSKVFKQFCSDLIIDLIKMFGSFLKEEVESRNVKTVNYTIIKTLLKSSHVLYNLENELGNTIDFIQKKYSLFNEFLETRSLKKEIVN